MGGTGNVVRKEFRDRQGRQCVRVTVNEWSGVAIRYRRGTHSAVACTNINGVLTNHQTWQAAVEQLNDAANSMLTHNCC